MVLCIKRALTVTEERAGTSLARRTLTPVCLLFAFFATLWPGGGFSSFFLLNVAHALALVKDLHFSSLSLIKLIQFATARQEQGHASVLSRMYAERWTSMIVLFGLCGRERAFICCSYIIGLLRAWNNPWSRSHMHCPQKVEEGYKKNPHFFFICNDGFRDTLAEEKPPMSNTKTEVAGWGLLFQVAVKKKKKSFLWHAGKAKLLALLEWLSKRKKKKKNMAHQAGNKYSVNVRFPLGSVWTINLMN